MFAPYRETHRRFQARNRGGICSVFLSCSHCQTNEAADWSDGQRELLVPLRTPGCRARAVLAQEPRGVITAPPSPGQLPGAPGPCPHPKMSPWQELPAPVRDRKQDYAVLGCGDHKNGLFGFWGFFSWLDIEIEHVRSCAWAVLRPPCSLDGNQALSPHSPAERAAQRTREKCEFNGFVS